MRDAGLEGNPKYQKGQISLLEGYPSKDWSEKLYKSKGRG